MADEIIGLAVISSVLPADPEPNPGVSSTELIVDVSMRDGDSVGVIDAPVRSPVSVDSIIVMVPDKPSAWDVSVPPSILIGGSELLSGTAEAPLPVGLGGEAG